MSKAENNEIKTIYKCAICNKEHPTIIERANCEQQCSKKLETERQKVLAEKKKKEQETRKVELDAELKYAYELYTKYLEDYGSYDFKFSKEEVNNFIDTIPFFKFFRPHNFFDNFWI